ncbi:hypothetical protein FOZ60_013942 [Perkinsus olseni]|uniref:S-adenosylmethionine synthase n=1 Tax=Perkinsus olseni TaxID=32597 RepID=A0A7J6PA32_PEROL|nr:hypothetical protein FOZ60_013942 [Perkinsus olseni]
MSPSTTMSNQTGTSVNEGHPDKICDQVSDAVLDACLAQDPDSRVACETCCKTGMVMIFGEITTRAKVDFVQVVRDTCKEIGYDDEAKGLDYRTMEVLNKLEEQSPEIGHQAPEEIGAGDQGHMFGYASNETPELMPLSHSLATKLGHQLTVCRKNGTVKWLRPDGKTQVTVEYKKGTSAPRSAKSRSSLMLWSTLLSLIVPKQYLDEDTIYHINPSKAFTIGGPHGDAGLTGRKIIIDTYGGWGAHGGGAFSGKDSTKASNSSVTLEPPCLVQVDRSAAYAARWAAKSLVHAGLCQRCLVQVSYAIGVVQPLSLFVDSFGSAMPGLSDEDLCDIVKRNFDFRPGCIQRDLELKKPQFQPLAAYGHFGRNDLMPAWEVVKDLEAEVASAEKKVAASS